MDIIDILNRLLLTNKMNNQLLNPWSIMESAMEKLYIQTVPFTINNYHFELFKPELYLCCCLFLIVLMSVYLRKFYNTSDVSIMTYKSVCLFFLLFYN